MERAQTTSTRGNAKRIMSFASGRMGRRVGAVAGGIFLALAVLVGTGFWHMNYVPADLDTSREQLSENGRYVVSYEPSARPVPINELHAWTIRVTTPDGEPVEDASITIDGDMPQHGHGLPTQPQATAYLGDGRYLIEGVKFQMTGWWFMQFDISDESRDDRVRFDFVLR